MQKLKIVIFTQAGLSVYNQSLFRRLIEDPLVDVAAIVVDEHPWRSQSLLKRVRKLGLGYLWWKTGKKIREKASGLLWRIWLGDHCRRGGPSGWDELAKSGVQIYRTADIHNSATLDFIRSLQAELGIICGGRIIKDSVLSLPRLGTLNIHKRKTPDYRGGGAIGYWEILNHEKEIAVTIHYAVAKVDEGAVLAQQPIPIEPYDTLKSLAVKAGVTGSDLYYKVIRDFAQGKREGLQIGRAHV